MAEPPIEEKTVTPLEKGDYEKLLTVIESMEPVAAKIGSARITQELQQLKMLVESELKELVYQDYMKTRHP